MEPNVKRIVQTNFVDIAHFVTSYVRVGEFLFSDDCDKIMACGIKDKKESSFVIGMSLNRVIDVPVSGSFTFSQNFTPINSKIQILLNGIVEVMLPKNWRLPYGQKMYVSPTGFLTWRKNQHKVGKTVSAQDKDGYVEVKIKC